MTRKRLKFEDIKVGDYVFSESLRQHYRIVKIHEDYLLAKKWNYLRSIAQDYHKKSRRHNYECQLYRNEINENFFDYSNAEFIKKYPF